MFSYIGDVFRLLRAGAALTRHDALVPLEYAHHFPLPLRLFGKLTRIGAKKHDGERLLRPGERLAKAFEGLGPFYVKTGQFMATRPDIIGFEMANDLCRLQDRMPPFSRDLAIAEIERSLNNKLGNLFTEFSEPIAAASIAQAHKAVTKDGEKVAVKILRPDIERTASKDFRALSRAAKLLEKISRNIRRMEPVKFILTLQEAARLELDLRLEAGAASQMADNLHCDTKMRIPAVVWPYLAKRVLTIEWIDGTPIGDLPELDKRGIDRPALAVQIMQTFLTQALHQGYFHADMHQGNMIIDEEGRLALIDFGIMGRLDVDARRTFAQIIFGFINRDYQHTAQVHFDAGYVEAHHSVDAFAQALRAVGEPMYGQNADKVDMSRVLQQLFDVTEMFDMHLRPELVLLQRTMVTVEGVARMLDPQINMWDCASPVIRSYIAGQVGPKVQIERVRDAALKAIEIAPKIPSYVEELATAANKISDERLGLSQTTTQELARAMAKESRATRAAMWFAGFGALVLAGILMVQ